MPEQPGTFHDEIIKAITRVETKVEGINTRLDRLNGHVGELFSRVEISETNLLKHQIECPIKEALEADSVLVRKRLDIAEKLLDAREQLRVNTEKWLNRWGKPAIAFALIMLIILVLIHASTFLQWLGIKP